MKIRRFDSIQQVPVAAPAAPARTKLPTRRLDGSIDARSDWEVNELKARLHAGLWSARVALVVSVPFALAGWAKGVQDAWLFMMLLPVVAAFFSGSFFGACLANPQQVPDECLAGRRGVFVALCAYILFALELAAMSVTPLETGLDVFMGSLVVSGWLVFPVSFFAGLMAFRAREGALRHQLRGSSATP